MQKIEIKKEDLIEYYVNKRLSIYKVAKILNCNPSTIRNNLLKFGIIMRTYSDSHLGLIRPIEVKEKISNYQKNKFVSEDTKKRMSIAQKGLLKSEECRKHNSEASKKKWQNLEYREKQEIARKNYQQMNLPNKPESFLLNLLNYLYPGEWEYTGNYSLVINGKNPDFANFQNKQIIEHFGTYWHKDDDPIKRMEIFAKEGWDTLVIWEDETKNNLDELIYKIKSFVEITV